MDKENKIKGCIVGGAIGDSLGLIVEKKTYEETQTFVKELSQNHLKTFTNRTYPITYRQGQISDDTQFSLHLIESLLEYQKFNAQDYQNRLVRAYISNELVGIGKNTKKIFESIIKNESTVQLLNNSSNGALMRAYVMGLFYRSSNVIQPYSDEQSKLTHDHFDSIISCRIIAKSISYLLHTPNSTIKDLRSKVWSSNDSKLLDLSFLDLSDSQFLEHIKNNYSRDGWEYVPPGAIVTLKAALYSAYHSQSFEEAIYRGISLGGDTDTVASLIGSLMGVHVGYNKLPQKWANNLYDQKFGNLSDILEICNKVSAVVL